MSHLFLLQSFKTFQHVRETSSSDMLKRIMQLSTMAKRLSTLALPSSTARVPQDSYLGTYTQHHMAYIRRNF